jgi:hypothetical protein
MRFRTFGFLIITIFLQLWLVSYATNAQVESYLDIEGGDLRDLKTQDSAEQPTIRCQVTVLIQGGGAVHAQLGDDSSIFLSDFNNQISVACDDTVNLTAVPADQWRFEGWEGVTDQLITSLSIQVRSGQGDNGRFCT